MGKNLVDLQKQAASTVDSLLHITEDIGKYVIAPYGTEDGAFVEIQCQIFLKRCQSLEKQLLQLQEALTFSENPAPPIFHNEASSLDVTRQIIIQNLQIVHEKQLLLQGFLSHSREHDAVTQESRLLQEQTRLLEFQRILGATKKP